MPPTSPQPLSDNNFSSRYEPKHIFGPKYGNLCPDPEK